MFGSFRLAMTWLHTWFGLVLGFVLMVAFFFGSLAVFASEIDRWAIPESRFEAQTLPSFDRVLRPQLERVEPEKEDLAEAAKRVDSALEQPLPPLYWSAYRDSRSPFVGFYAEFKVDNPKDEHDYVHGHSVIDPRNGRLVAEGQLPIGSDFFYPLHFGLHLSWMDLGIWIVGLSALAMLVALISGVVIHKKFFREFFTFRSEKKGQRRLLDLHNLTGVVALPFHFMFAFTGLAIFGGIYFPLSETMFQRVQEHQEVIEAQAGGRPAQRAGVLAPLAPVDPMVAEAQRRWAQRGAPREVSSVSVTYVGDANSYVSVHPLTTNRLTFGDQSIHFEAKSGRLLADDPPPSALVQMNDFLVALHLLPFEHWALRWLYVSGGLMSCACIATGFIFFVGKRKQKHAAQGVAGARWVDALAVTAVTGMLLATLSMLVANRLVPSNLPEGGAWQQRVFWLTWLLSFVHAALRTAAVGAGRFAPAWREQCWGVAALAVAAVLLNGVTTGDHLLATIGRGYWPVAGVDLALLATAAVATLAALRLGRAERAGLPVESDDAREESPEGLAHG